MAIPYYNVLLKTADKQRDEPLGDQLLDSNKD
jgi:hypothetical protein